MRAVTQLEHRGAAAPRTDGSDWALVRRAIAGDAASLELLMAPELGRLYRVALAMLRNREDAEDALQDALCNAIRRLPSFEGRSLFSTWLTHIVINSALTILRRRKNRPESSLDQILENRAEGLALLTADRRPNPEQICALVEFNALLEEQILNLPALDQAAFRHHVLDGHSIVEFCLTLGVPETTFKSRIFRTRRKVARGLQHSLGWACASTPKEETAHVA